MLAGVAIGYVFDSTGGSMTTSLCLFGVFSALHQLCLHKSLRCVELPWFDLQVTGGLCAAWRGAR
jgi:hypothetical protein